MQHQTHRPDSVRPCGFASVLPILLALVLALLSSDGMAAGTPFVRELASGAAGLLHSQFPVTGAASGRDPPMRATPPLVPVQYLPVVQTAWRTRLVYTAPRPRAAPPATEIRTVRADGTGSAVIFRSDAQQRAYAPTWSPDGSQIAFLEAIGVAAHIMVRSSTADGAPRTWSLSKPAGNLSWSPDGAWLLVETQSATSLYWLRVPADLSSQEVVSLFWGTGTSSVAWSPDSQLLAFNGYRGISVARNDGTQPTVVTADVESRGQLTWSPDGNWLVAPVFAAAGAHALYIIHPDGSGGRMLADCTGTCDCPTWAPDSTTVIYVDDVPDGSGGSQSVIMRVNADGSGAVRLAEEALANWSVAGCPSWSSSSRGIVFAARNLSAISEESHILVMRADGSEAADLGPGSEPQWKP